MSDGITVNPYLQLQPVDEDTSQFFLSAPQKGVGVNKLLVKQGENPNLFEVFSDLSTTRFDFLDPENDLSSADVSLLLNNGVLLPSTDIPSLPAFSCRLDEVPPFDGDIEISGLRLNPTLRFEPFDLRTFAATLHEKHLSPYEPSVWVRTGEFEIEMGYWLDAGQAGTISALIAGEIEISAIDQELLKRLVSAEILISDGVLAETFKSRHEQVSAASAEFGEKGYAVIKGLLPPHQMASYRRFYRQYVSEGFMPFGDPQVPLRYQQHNEPLAAFLHKTLLPVMETVVGEPLKPSYVYAASYKPGSVLDPHVDRAQCEYSISFQVDYEPEQPDQRSLWPIYVEPRKAGMPEESIGWETIDRKSASKFQLASGDALFYKGRELVHYRDALPDGHRSTSLFFHFVPFGFEGSLD